MDQVAESVVPNPQAEGTTQFSTLPPKKIPSVVFIIIGILVSLGVGAFIWFRPFTGVQNMPEVQVSASPKAEVLTLTVTSPIDGALSVNQEMLVTGKTLPNTTVVLFTETDENSVQSDGSGMFESTVTLAEGINTLTVTVFGEDGTEKSQTMDLVYDSET